MHPNSDELLAQNIVPPGYEILRAPSKDANGNKTMIPYIVERAPATGMIGTNRVALTGKYVKQARPERDPVTNDPEIRLDFNSEGAELFAQITRELAPKGNKHFYLAIVLDGELYSAPRILGEIPGGSARITGSFEVSEAIELANVLENPLEAPVEIRDERSVDPSLGKDTIKSGVNSAIYGTIAVAGFMAIYYLFAGMVANIALITNIILLFGVMCYSGATLTLANSDFLAAGVTACLFSQDSVMHLGAVRGADIFVMKLNQAGQVQYATYFGGRLNDNAARLAPSSTRTSPP